MSSARLGSFGLVTGARTGDTVDRPEVVHTVPALGSEYASDRGCWGVSSKGAFDTDPEDVDHTAGAGLREKKSKNPPPSRAAAEASAEPAKLWARCCSWRERSCCRRELRLSTEADDDDAACARRELLLELPPRTARAFERGRAPPCVTRTRADFMLDVAKTHPRLPFCNVERCHFDSLLIHVLRILHVHVYGSADSTGAELHAHLVQQTPSSAPAATV